MNPSRALLASEFLTRNLRRLREERGLTLNDLGRRAGIGTAHLDAIEAGNVHAHLDEVSILALGLGVRIIALFATE